MLCSWLMWWCITVALNLFCATYEGVSARSWLGSSLPLDPEERPVVDCKDLTRDLRVEVFFQIKLKMLLATVGECMHMITPSGIVSVQKNYLNRGLNFSL